LLKQDLKDLRVIVKKGCFNWSLPENCVNIQPRYPAGLFIFSLAYQSECSALHLSIK